MYLFIFEQGGDWKDPEIGYIIIVGAQIIQWLSGIKKIQHNPIIL
jgi:hypothetical protein